MNAFFEKFQKPRLLEQMFVLAYSGWGPLYVNQSEEAKLPAKDIPAMLERLEHLALHLLEQPWCQRDTRLDMLLLLRELDGDAALECAQEIAKKYYREPKKAPPTGTEPTEDQLKYLKALRHDGEIPATRREVSELIDKLKAEKGTRRRAA